LTGSFAHRPLEAGDLDVASALHVDAFAPLGERAWTRQEIAELLAAPGVAGILVQDEREAAGFALCRVAADEAELLTIAVRGDRRRRGLGVALLRLVIALVRERGASHLFLEVGSDNPAALQLYRQAGFEAVGRRSAYYSRSGQKAADAIVMRLELD
jgi:ribosomal-protein-alanine N-acetyltransferase